MDTQQGRCPQCGFDFDKYRSYCLPASRMDDYHAKYACRVREIRSRIDAEHLRIKKRFQAMLDEQTQLMNQAVELRINSGTLYEMGRLFAQHRREFWQAYIG